MPIVPFKKLLERALDHRYVVGYFESWNLDSIEAVLSAAEELDSPVILGFGGKTVNKQWFENGGLKYLAALGREAAERSKVPVSFILNEVNFELGIQGIDLGFNVIMLDTSELNLTENIKVTKEIVKIAHKKLIGVEAELGSLPDEGKDTRGILTDPEEARYFVKETGIDALAVSIGNIHLKVSGEASIDLDRLKKIREFTNIPLVIHGGSGFPKSLIKDSIKSGAVKFNIGTVLKKVYIEGVTEKIKKSPENFDIQSVVGSRYESDFTHVGKQNIKQQVKFFISFFGSANHR